MIAYGTTFCLGKVAMQTYGVGVIEFSFIRFITILGVSGAMLKWDGRSAFEGLTGDEKRGLFIRSAISTIAFTSVNIAVLMLPLTIFSTV
jgi:drug/metabolite transporter (DMT)-like permease